MFDPLTRGRTDDHEAFRETMVDVEARMETRVRGADEGGNQRDENRTTGNIVYATFVHTVSRPIGGVPDPHCHIHCYVFNATFDPVEERWKALQFMNLKGDAPFFLRRLSTQVSRIETFAAIDESRTDELSFPGCKGGTWDTQTFRAQIWATRRPVAHTHAGIRTEENICRINGITFLSWWAAARRRLQV
jgi:hypothetical protein